MSENHPMIFAEIARVFYSYWSDFDFLIDTYERINEATLYVKDNKKKEFVCSVKVCVSVVTMPEKAGLWLIDATGKQLLYKTLFDWHTPDTDRIKRELKTAFDGYVGL